MTGQVLSNFFSHEHNPMEVAIQEYRHAKEHFREVMKYRDCTNPEHQRRFRDALERQEAARERYVKLLTER